MDEDLQNIEDLFKKGLEANLQMPPQKIWDSIDNMLDKEKVIAIKSKYDSLKKITLLLLLLFSGGLIYELGGWFKNKGRVKINKQVKSTDNFTADKNVTILGTKGQQLGNLPGKEQTPLTFTNPYKNSGKYKGRPVGSAASAYKVSINNTGATKDVFQHTGSNNVMELPLSKEINILYMDKIILRVPDGVSTAKIMLPASVNFTIKKNTLPGKKIKEKKQPHFFITPYFSPDVAWYRLDDDNPDNQPDSRDEIKSGERHEFSSTFGVMIDFKLNEHLTVESGLTYSNTNISIDPKSIYAQKDNSGHVQYRINTSSGYGYVLPSFSGNPAVGDSLTAFVSAHNLQYIGFPVAVKYCIAGGRFSLNTMFGVSVNFLTKGEIETTVAKNSDNETDIVNNIQGLKKIYSSGLTGLTTEYKLNKRLALSFAPTFRFALNAINSGAVVKSFPKSFGFATGLKISL